MALYHDAEIRKGGKLIRVNVVVDASVPLTTADLEWGGTLHPPNNIGLTLGETYTLVLPGYSAAKIEITSEANPVDGTVTFKGVGELRAAKPAEEVHGAK